MSAITSQAGAISAERRGDRQRQPQSIRLTRRQRLWQGLWVGVAVSMLLLLMQAGNLFTTLRLALNDVYFIPQPVSGQVVIVALDNASLAAYGRSPVEWPRGLYGDLIDRLSAAGARVVVFDLLFTEPTEDDPLLADALRRARTGASRTRLVIAAAGQRNQTAPADIPVMRYDDHLSPVTDLADAVDYVGYTNVFADADGALRRQLSLVQIDGQPAYSLSVAAYLAYLRIPPEAAGQLVQPTADGLAVTPERTLPVDAFGLWRQNYFGPPTDTFTVVSLRDVLNDAVDPAQFADKLVLVGLRDATGATDRYPVPISRNLLMSGVEIQANAIETLLQNTPLTDQPLPARMMTIVLLALGASLVYTQLRWYWALAVMLLFVVLWLVGTFVSFTMQRLVVDQLYALLALSLPALIVLGLQISIEISRRRKTEFLLQSVVNVANQRLSLDHMLPYLAADLRQILDAPTGLICLPERARLNSRHTWGAADALPALQALCQQISMERPFIRQADTLAQAIIWQQRVLAVFAVRLPPRRPLTRTQRALIDDLTGQIAPNLDNAVLYAEVQRQKQLLEAVFLGSPAAIAVLDGALRPVRANALLQKLLLDDATLQANATLLDLLDQTAITRAARDEIDASFRRGVPFRHDLHLGARVYHLDAVKLPGFDQWVVLLSDVTTLVELSQLKTRMIRMASHDLKNPLARVTGYGELILEMETTRPTLPPEYRRFIESIIQSGQVMHSIITDLLNLEQLRSGEIEREVAAVQPILRGVIARYDPDIAAKRQTLHTDLTADPLHVLANDVQLSQMIANLLSNAIKYTPDGGTITVRLGTTPEGNIRLEIEDTGYGIPKDAQAKLFSEFFRVRTRETAHIEGTGLGLSLVKSVVDAHDGRIWLESEEGVGSTFFVELPLHVAGD